MKIHNSEIKIGDKVIINNFTMEDTHRGIHYTGEMVDLIGKMGVVVEIEDFCQQAPYAVKVKSEEYSWWFIAEDLTKVEDMQRKFEIVEAYKGKIDESFIPERNDDGSAGYDLRAAEDIIIPSILRQRNEAFEKMLDTIDAEGEDSLEYALYEEGYVPTLSEAEALTKEYNLRATLVPTGLKAKFPKGESLDVYDRSSTGVKLLLSLPHAVGIIDSTYYNNEENEGHIMIPLINNLPFDIKIQKGERIAQAIFRPYEVKTNDKPINTTRKGGVGSSGR